MLKDSSDVSLITADDGAAVPRSRWLLLPQPGIFCRCCSLKTPAENWEKTVFPSGLVACGRCSFCVPASLIPAHGTQSCALANLHIFKIYFSFLHDCQDRGQLRGRLICCCTDLAKAGGENPTASRRGHTAFMMQFSQTLSITKQTNTPSPA